MTEIEKLKNALNAAKNQMGAVAVGYIDGETGTPVATSIDGSLPEIVIARVGAATTDLIDNPAVSELCKLFAEARGDTPKDKPLSDLMFRGVGIPTHWMFRCSRPGREKHIVVFVFPPKAKLGEISILAAPAMKVIEASFSL